jgi:hypothetical protein
MREAVFKVRGTVYLAEYEHKHGNDHSIHTTHEGAQNYFRDIVSDWKAEFLDEDDSDPYNEYSLDELIESWGEITGHTEFFNIYELELQK